MKTIGLIGGMSWESTAEYYRIVNETVKREAGGLHSAKCVLYSVDFHEVEALQREGRWDELDGLMADAGLRLSRAGAAFIVICTNTMHVSAPVVERETGLPVLHIADVAGASARERGLSRLGLLGTRFTMEGSFYTAVLSNRFGIDVIVPEPAERETVHRIIYEELCLGVVKEASRRAYLEVIEGLGKRGAQGVVLGCTEIPLLVKQEHVELPVLDTTRLHAEAAARKALEP